MMYKHKNTLSLYKHIYLLASGTNRDPRTENYAIQNETPCNDKAPRILTGKTNRAYITNINNLFVTETSCSEIHLVLIW